MINYLTPDWKNLLKKEFEKEYFKTLSAFVDKEYQTATIYPPFKSIFNALNNTNFNAIKVIIIGQDPYHNHNQAHGLSFSVNKNIKIPPSLKNIYKELQTDIGIEIPSHGNLNAWAAEGVLLLNATLTVRHNEPASHQKKGWEQFTDEIIRLISHQKTHCVFLLWGNFAKSKAILINEQKHKVLQAAHPSPLARGAFFGCKHFSLANQYLISNGIKPVNWILDENNLFSDR